MNVKTRQQKLIDFLKIFENQQSLQHVIFVEIRYDFQDNQLNELKQLRLFLKNTGGEDVSELLWDVYNKDDYYDSVDSIEDIIINKTKFIQEIHICNRPGIYVHKNNSPSLH